MKRICVFCGSSFGSSPAYLEAARSFGPALASQNLGLVYGGAAIGLMGALADSAMEAGVEVIGVIPQSLVDREIAHAGLSDLRIVSTMHERKAAMADLSDGFAVLPGGAGTLEEFFEAWTWGQLGLHDKPCGLLNVENYFEGLLSMVDEMVHREFIAERFAGTLIVEETAGQLLTAFLNYRPPPHKFDGTFPPPRP